MNNQIIVIKYGGNAMVSEELKKAVLEDVVALQKMGYKPVVSHGGGPGINKMLKALDIPTHFVTGLRYTDAATLDAVEAVLIGQVGTGLVSRLEAAGGKAVGLSGVSGQLYHCRLQDEIYGLVGEIDAVNTEVVEAVLAKGFIPVVAPIGTDGCGQDYNINGDTAAAMLASALKAEKLLLLTDIEGLCNSIEKRDVIAYLNVKDVPALKERGVIAGGMLPKVDGCVKAIEEGVGSVHIIDGRRPHSILDVFTKAEPGGTEIGTEKESIGIKE